jgi:seryl-tRNA synthetase
MPSAQPGTAEQQALLGDLVERGLLVPSAVPGLYGRGAPFERIRVALADLVTRAAAPEQPEPIAFPPLIPRRDLELVGYLKTFPHLAGSVFSFEGDEQAAAGQSELAAEHADWSGYQSMTDVVLTPAACYPVYPAIAARGRLPVGGVTIDAGAAYVFRHEPSSDPARMQMFHQREMVRIGEPDVVHAWRETWREKAVETLSGLGLDAELELANDPFFGRAGRMLATSQRAQELKFEVTTPIAGPGRTAVASFNYHQDHFGEAFHIELQDGSPAHSACLGFGLERITLALFAAHGFSFEDWPESVRGQLWP